MEFYELLPHYQPGYYLFQQVLKRFFKGNELAEIIQKLTENKLFIEAKLYRCPHCRYILLLEGQDELEDVVYCPDCDKELKLSSLTVEPVWIRTDKELVLNEKEELS